MSQEKKPNILRYRLERLLGVGGQGEVWQGVDERLGRVVAVKILNPQRIGVERMENFRRRFRREGHLTAALEHPNIVRLYDFGQTEEDLPYMVMEFVDGITMLRRIQETVPMPLPTVLNYLFQLADALDYAHARGMVHRDLKPDNIMIDRWDRVRVMDFGLARLINDDDSFGVESWRMIDKGFVMGSPGYMSPEQAFGRPVNERSDLFSLGMITYTMIAGRHPFMGDPQSMVVKTAKQPAPPFASFNREVDADLENALRLAITLDPAQRPSTVREWWMAVREAASRSPRLV